MVILGITTYVLKGLLYSTNEKNDKAVLAEVIYGFFVMALFSKPRRSNWLFINRKFEMMFVYYERTEFAFKIIILKKIVYSENV